MATNSWADQVYQYNATFGRPGTVDDKQRLQMLAALVLTPTAAAKMSKADLMNAWQGKGSVECLIPRNLVTIGLTS